MDTVKLPADFIRHDLVGQALLSVHTNMQA